MLSYDTGFTCCIHYRTVGTTFLVAVAKAILWLIDRHSIYPSWCIVSVTVDTLFSITFTLIIKENLFPTLYLRSAFYSPTKFNKTEATVAFDENTTSLLSA